MTNEYERYLSPFSWRYGSDEMRRLWSERYKRQLWRELWVALARAQSELGLVRAEQVEDLQAHVAEVDMPQALEIEAEIHHDLMAELRVFAGQSPLGKGILHLGATSTDIEDNADALRLRRSLDLILSGLSGLLDSLAEKILAYADLPIIAFTHLQPAEPSTLGYRLCFYAQDLLLDWEHLSAARGEIQGKGFKGAVGTGAAYAELLGPERFNRFEARLSELLDLPFFPVTGQTYPRKQDYFVISALAGMGASIYKFAFDLRLLQSPVIGEWSEPFSEKQVGSSAMPFKRNPVNAEKVDSLARSLSQMPPIAWQNAASSLLERTLDDSANRRSLLPEAFLISDELIITATRLVKGLQVNRQAVARNLDRYAPFAGMERVLMALVKAGADRQEMHERLREHAMQAWQAAQNGQANPVASLVAQDPAINRYLPPDEIEALIHIDQYLGIAPERSTEFAQAIRRKIQSIP